MASLYQHILPDEVTATSKALAEVEKELSALLDEETRLDAQAAEKRFFIAPIRKLPPELLSLICLTAVEASQQPSSLMPVSHAFYDATVNTPRIWSTLNVFEGKKERYYWECWTGPIPARPCFTAEDVELVLSRTKSAPIDIAINLGYSDVSIEAQEEKLTHLMKEGRMEHWRRLDIDNVSAIQESEPLDDDGNRPLPKFQFKGRLRDLKELNLSAMIPSLLQILEESLPEKLEKVVIGAACHKRRFIEHKSWLQPVKELELMHWGNDGGDFTTSIVAACPNLERLELDGMDTDCGVNDEMFTSSKLHTLHISGSLAFVHAKISSLTHLNIRHAQIVTHADTQYLRLPVLHTLEWMGYEHTLLRLIEAPKLHTLIMNFHSFDDCSISFRQSSQILEETCKVTWKMESTTPVENLLIPSHHLCLKSACLTEETLLKLLSVIGKSIEELVFEGGYGNGLPSFYNGLECPLPTPTPSLSEPKKTGKKKRGAVPANEEQNNEQTNAQTTEQTVEQTTEETTDQTTVQTTVQTSEEAGARQSVSKEIICPNLKVLEADLRYLETYSANVDDIRVLKMMKRLMTNREQAEKPLTIKAIFQSGGDGAEMAPI